MTQLLFNYLLSAGTYRKVLFYFPLSDIPLPQWFSLHFSHVLRVYLDLNSPKVLQQLQQQTQSIEMKRTENNVESEKAL